DRATAYTAAVTHLFGTCRMGADAASSVVRPDFRHHAVDGLWVADSSVFPTNLGVNPQVPIMAMATLCARRVLAADAPPRGPRPTTSDRRDAMTHPITTMDGSDRPPAATSQGAPSARRQGADASASPGRRITLDDLLRMDRHELHAIIDRGHPLDPDALAGHQYQGVDLSLPPWVNRILWKTFRKTFHRDPATGAVRGWNVRMEQQGIDGPRVPKKRRGATWHFAHYELRSTAGQRFPRGWHGPHFLDYGRVGNPFGENLGWTPLVAVNEGDMSLLLGWEVFRLGPLFIPLRDYWALRLEGPLDEIFPTPKDSHAASAR
ncbi:MAG: GMC family oxidoreductase, partial [Alphaproteobacteria bacterium]